MADTKQEKVFCYECKHCYTDGIRDLCDILRDTWALPHQPSMPYIKNAGNDCPDFEPKQRDA